MFKAPTTIDDMILTKSIKTQLNIIEKMKGFYLFHSKSTGSGKTLSAKIIASSISNSALYIDCSCSRSSKAIDSIDGKLSGIELSGGIPVIVIDEVDKLSSTRMQIISAAYNKFNDRVDCVVIMTANDIDKIPQNLVSRVEGVDFNAATDIDSIMLHVSKIVDEKSDDKVLNKKFIGMATRVLQATNCDIRKIMSYTKKFILTGEIDDSPLLTDGY